MFLSMGGNISSLDVRIEEAELILRTFKQPRDFTVKQITFFDGNLF